MMRWRSYVEMPVSTYDVSTMCQDPNLLDRFKRSGGACLSPSYISDWLFSESRHLAILSNSIKPWPMTMASKQDEGQSSCGNEVEGFNSMISPWKHGTMQQNEKKTYPFGPTGRHNLCKCTKSELHEVLRFFCLDLGCQHTRGESYLATGCLNFNVIDERCDNSCSICSKKWHNQFLPVYCSSVVAFLDYLMQTEDLPQEVDYKAPISSLLAKSKFWKEAIFDCAASVISQMQVDALFLSLTASGIIQMVPKMHPWSGSSHRSSRLRTVVSLNFTLDAQYTR
jgi:hypothetical protein